MYRHPGLPARIVTTLDVLSGGRALPPLGDVDAFVADVAEYAALGVTEVQIMPDRHPVEFAEQIAGQVLPRLSALG